MTCAVRRQFRAGSAVSARTNKKEKARREYIYCVCCMRRPSLCVNCGKPVHRGIGFFRNCFQRVIHLPANRFQRVLILGRNRDQSDGSALDRPLRPLPVYSQVISHRRLRRFGAVAQLAHLIRSTFLTTTRTVTRIAHDSMFGAVLDCDKIKETKGRTKRRKTGSVYILVLSLTTRDEIHPKLPCMQARVAGAAKPYCHTARLGHIIGSVNVKNSPSQAFLLDGSSPQSHPTSGGLV